MATACSVWRQRWSAALLPIPILWVAAVVAGIVPRQASGLSAIWLANPMLLGCMVLFRGTRGGVALLSASALVTGLMLYLAAGSTLPAAGLVAVANVAECLVAAELMRRLDVRPGFDRVRDVGMFLGACLAGTCCSAVIGAEAASLSLGASYVQAWRDWFCASLLGQMLVTPAILLGAAWVRQGWQKPSVAQVTEMVILFAILAGVATTCFFNAFPFLFLIGPAMLIVVVRLRAVGAVVATSIVAVIAVSAQAAGYGPMVRRLADPVDQIMVLQLFLATLFLSSLPVAALLAERDAQARQAQLMAKRFRAVVEAVGEVIFRTDLRGHWTYLNPAWKAVTGYEIADSLGASSLHHVHQDDRAELLDRTLPIFLGAVAESRRVLRFHTRDGGVRWMELFVQALRDGEGAIVGSTGTLRDIDDRKRLEEHVTLAKRQAEERAREAATLAATDELTGLANRRAFLRQLECEIAAAQVADRPLAVAIFDVDHFKRINDCHGHAVGDDVLRQLARRANGIVRVGDLVGRLGGEEFAVVMPGATAIDAAVIAERLREAMERPRADGPDLPHFTVSVGIAMRDERLDATSLLANADVALYRAKNGGRNQVRLAA